MNIEETIKQLDFDVLYLKIYHHKDVYDDEDKIKVVYLNEGHEKYIKQWLKDGFNKLSDQYKHLVDYESI